MDKYISKYKKICVENKDYPNIFLIVIKKNPNHVLFDSDFEFVIFFYKNIQ